MTLRAYRSGGDRPIDVIIRPSKLQAPRGGGPLIARERVHARLRAALESPVTLVCAPPASGKTALLDDGLSDVGLPVAWLSLDDGDEDLRRLVAHVMAAVESVTDGACEATDALLIRDPSATAADLGEVLAGDLDAINEPFVLVLDDYTSVPGNDVHALFGAILRHPPAAVRLVIVARYDPPLPLQALRGQGLLAELRHDVLAFTPAETGELLESIWGREVDVADVARIHGRFEGWGGGLCLWASAVRDDPPDAVLDGLPSSVHVVDSFLRDEVLTRLPAAVQDALLRCSILREFTVGTCAAVIDDAAIGISAVDLLRRLEDERVFLVRVESAEPGTWFRFRRVFADYLAATRDKRMPEDDVRAINDRAAAWFVERGMFREAVEHALCGTRPASAAEIVAANRTTLLNEGRWPELAELLAKLPQTTAAVSVQLMLARAWMAPSAFMSGPVDELERALESADLAEAEHRAVRGELAFLRACVLVGSAQEDVPDLTANIALLVEALDLLPLAHREARATSRHLLAGAYQMSGDVDRALETLSEGIAEQGGRETHQTVVLLHGMCIVHLAEGDLDALHDAATNCTSVVLRTQASRAFVDLATAMLAFAYYTQNDTRSAGALLRSSRAGDSESGRILLAQIAQAEGRDQDARRLVRATFDARVGEHTGTGAAYTRSVEAWIALRQGRLADALRWAERARPLQLRPRHDGQRAALAAAEILIAGGAPERLQRADDLLQRVLEHARATHDRPVELRAHAVMALLLDARGDATGSEEALLRSLTLAQRGRFLRTYTDLGDRMLRLLARLSPPADLAEFVGSVLATFDAPPPAATPAHDAQPLLDPLSDREMDVLRLLGERLSNKEIASRLFISIETVKRHAATIYQKLHVHGRRQAVARAEELGLL